MAERIGDMERLARIFIVGEYYKTHPGVSVREAAVEISNLYFPIKKTTVDKYINLYAELESKDKELIKNHLEANRTKTYNDPEVQKILLVEVELLTKGYTMEQIAEILNKDYSSVQRDLSDRLSNLAKKDDIYKELYESTQIILKSNKEKNYFGQEKKSCK